MEICKDYSTHAQQRLFLSIISHFGMTATFFADRKKSNGLDGLISRFSPSDMA
jgi:hypothetical protein